MSGNKQNKQKLRGLSPQARTIPTERPPLVGEVSANFSGYRVSLGQRNESTTVINFGFLDRSRYYPVNVWKGIINSDEDVFGEG
jgi:hypothetical protein